MQYIILYYSTPTVLYNIRPSKNEENQKQSGAWGHDFRDRNKPISLIQAPASISILLDRAGLRDCGARFEASRGAFNSGPKKSNFRLSNSNRG